jgi:hypothetical protein
VSNKFKKNELGGSCGVHGEEDRCIKGFDGELWGTEATLETQAQIER